LAFVAGYIVGGRGGDQGFDEVTAALQSVRDSDEFADLLKALRSHASHLFHELGRRLEVETDQPVTIDTFLKRASNYVRNDATGTAF
jgi:glucan phosphorylase